MRPALTLRLKWCMSSLPRHTVAFRVLESVQDVIGDLVPSLSPEDEVGTLPTVVPEGQACQEVPDRGLPAAFEDRADGCEPPDLCLGPRGHRSE